MTKPSTPQSLKKGKGLNQSLGGCRPSGELTGGRERSAPRYNNLGEEENMRDREISAPRYNHLERENMIDDREISAPRYNEENTRDGMSSMFNSADHLWRGELASSKFQYFHKQVVRQRG